MWQADVALCRPIRWQDEYLLADIGRPVVTILPVVLSVFSILMAWPDRGRQWVHRGRQAGRSFGYGNHQGLCLWEGIKSANAVAR